MSADDDHSACPITVEQPVAVWSCPLDLPEAAHRRLTRCLATDELDRADHLHQALDRERFLAARGWRRHVLAGQLGCAPEDVEFVVGEHGKPSVVGSDLRFSASRSAALALLAAGWGIEVGVDLEAITDTVDTDGVANRFFTKFERAALAAVPAAPRRRTAFFDCWTRKEAYAKAIGIGLRLALDSVDVWAGDERPVIVGGWAVRGLAIADPPGFAAAVAAAGTAGRIPSDRRQWSVSVCRGTMSDL
jgi:4'-phosphopantetheinyl transferase